MERRLIFVHKHRGQVDFLSLFIRCNLDLNTVVGAKRQTLRVGLCTKLMWVSRTHAVELRHVLLSNMYARWRQVGGVVKSMVPTSLFNWVNAIVAMSSSQNRC